MPAKVTAVFSLTIRPRGGLRPNVLACFDTLVANKVAYDIVKAIAVVEQPGDETSRHLQCGLILAQPKSSQTFKRYISSIFDPVLDDDERKHTICLHAHHDQEGLVGYCVKENLNMSDPYFRRGFTDEELAAGNDKYQEILRQRQLERDKSVTQTSFPAKLKMAYWNIRHCLLDDEGKYLSPEQQINECLEWLLRNDYNVMPFITTRTIKTYTTYWAHFIHDHEQEEKNTTHS